MFIGESKESGAVDGGAREIEVERKGDVRGEWLRCKGVGVGVDEIHCGHGEMERWG